MCAHSGQDMGKNGMIPGKAVKADAVHKKLDHARHPCGNKWNGRELWAGDAGDSPLGWQ